MPADLDTNRRGALLETIKALLELGKEPEQAIAVEVLAAHCCASRCVSA